MLNIVGHKDRKHNEKNAIVTRSYVSFSRVNNEGGFNGPVIFISIFKSILPRLIGKHLDRHYDLRYVSFVLVSDADYMDKPTWVKRIEIFNPTTRNIEASRRV